LSGAATDSAGSARESARVTVCLKAWLRMSVFLQLMVLGEQSHRLYLTVRRDAGPALV
jgi:hypothetical protein